MKREQKEIFIKNLKAILSENSLVLVFHYRGMSMTDMNVPLTLVRSTSACNVHQSVYDWPFCPPPPMHSGRSGTVDAHPGPKCIVEHSRSGPEARARARRSA